MIKTVTFALAASTALLGASLAAEPSGDSGRKLTASLSGANEVPGPGDADGMGSFTARINPGQGQLCYTLSVQMIDAAGAAHIHNGAAGVAGGVAVALTAPAAGATEQCTTITRELAMELVQNPQNYYVNVHNAAFPGGAIRGQLSK